MSWLPTVEFHSLVAAVGRRNLKQEEQQRHGGLNSGFLIDLRPTELVPVYGNRTAVVGV